MPKRVATKLSRPVARPVASRFAVGTKRKVDGKTCVVKTRKSSSGKRTKYWACTKRILKKPKKRVLRGGGKTELKAALAVVLNEKSLTMQKVTKFNAAYAAMLTEMAIELDEELKADDSQAIQEFCTRKIDASETMHLQAHQTMRDLIQFYSVDRAVYPADRMFSVSHMLLGQQIIKANQNDNIYVAARAATLLPIVSLMNRGKMLDHNTTAVGPGETIAAVLARF